MSNEEKKVVLRQQLDSVPLKMENETDAQYIEKLIVIHGYENSRAVNRIELGLNIPHGHQFKLESEILGLNKLQKNKGSCVCCGRPFK